MSTPKIRPSDYPFAGTPSSTPRTDAQEIDLSTHTATEGFSPNRRKVDKYVPAKLSRQLETELAAAKAECDLNRTRLASIFWSGAMDKFTGGDVQQWVTDYTAELARLRAELGPLRELVGVDSRAASALSDINHWRKLMDAWDDNARLRADLERFTGHGLLDCHAICDQRDAAIAERDRLRAEVERADVMYQRACEVEHDLRAENERLKATLLSIEEDGTSEHNAAVGLRHNLVAAIARAERFEADAARLDWLERNGRFGYKAGTVWSDYFAVDLSGGEKTTLRAAIDAAMKP